MVSGVPSQMMRPGVQADHALRELHHRLHDVLDHDDGDAGGVQLEQDLQHLADLVRRQPGHRLVRDQQAAAARPSRAPVPACAARPATAGWTACPPCRPGRCRAGSPSPRRACRPYAASRGAPRTPAAPPGSPAPTCWRRAAGSGSCARCRGACAGRPAAARSPRRRTRMLPPSLSSAPEMQLISVVLPEPFGPIRPKRSPLAISMLDLVERREAAELLGHAS